jgi:hypothetical protein
MICSCNNKEKSRVSPFEVFQYSINKNENKRFDCLYYTLLEEECNEDIDTNFFFRMTISTDTGTIILKVKKHENNFISLSFKQIESNCDDLFELNSLRSPVKYIMYKKYDVFDEKYINNINKILRSLSNNTLVEKGLDDVQIINKSNTTYFKETKYNIPNGDFDCIYIDKNKIMKQFHFRGTFTSESFNTFKEIENSIKFCEGC